MFQEGKNNVIYTSVINTAVNCFWIPETYNEYPSNILITILFYAVDSLHFSFYNFSTSLTGI